MNNISRELLANVQPIGRMGKPEEIAAMALHLCGPEAEWTTGSVITVDGGQTAAQIQPILFQIVNYYEILEVEEDADEGELVANEEEEEEARNECEDIADTVRQLLAWYSGKANAYEIMEYISITNPDPDLVGLAPA